MLPVRGEKLYNGCMQKQAMTFNNGFIAVNFLLETMNAEAE